MLKTTILPVSGYDIDTIENILKDKSITYEQDDYDMTFSCSEDSCDLIMREISKNSPNEIQAIHKSSEYDYYGAFKKTYRGGKVIDSFFTFDYDFQWINHFAGDYKTLGTIEDKLSEFFLQVDHIYEISWHTYNSLHFLMNKNKIITVEMDLEGYHIHAKKEGPYITVSSEVSTKSPEDEYVPYPAEECSRLRSTNIIGRDFEEEKMNKRLKHAPLTYDSVLNEDDNSIPLKDNSIFDDSVSLNELFGDTLSDSELVDMMENF